MSDTVVIDLETDERHCYQCLAPLKEAYRPVDIGILVCATCAAAGMVRQYAFTTCQICENDEEILFTECGHAICRQCIENWQPQLAIIPCPVCRHFLFRTMLVVACVLSLGEVKAKVPANSGGEDDEIRKGLEALVIKEDA